ncbi:MAG: hypothetical protein C0507_24385 [Cyanobacteria bacterium PR.3.49]|nr:hypothetical protein [Cyanobacteria bacterium PR.3.49]
MTQRSLPRYFVSRQNDDSFADCVSTLDPCHAIDSFFIGGRHLVEREWVVTIDSSGYLKATDGEKLGSLPAEVQQDLAFNEVIGSAASRTLDSSHVYLFYLEALEQPPETPGINDPVYLYGTLYGPFPAPSGESARGIPGQLTINRMDLLAGLVDSAKFAFNYQAASGSQTQRCFNLLLPGDREEEIAQGKGLVMAYPLMPAEVVMGEPWNEIVVCGLVFDILSALKEDLEKEKVSHPLRTTTLPVPNRTWVVQQLETNGWAVKGNVATRLPGANIGMNKMLSMALGTLIKDKTTIPPQGSINDYIELAEMTIRNLPGFPPSRLKTLRSRVRPVSPEARAQGSRAKTAAMQPARTPKGQTFPAQTANSPPAKKSDWMQDFIAGHRPAGAAETRLTTMSALASNRASTPPNSSKKPEKKLNAKPDWMSDFDSSPAGKEKINSQEKEEIKEKKNQNSWMKDFE